MRAQVLQLIGGALAVDVRGTSLDRERDPAPSLFVPPPARRRRRDRVRVKRVAGPAGFRWHVQTDGRTISSYATEAEAKSACDYLKKASR